MNESWLEFSVCKCMTTDRWRSEGRGLVFVPAANEKLAIDYSSAHAPNVH